MTKIPGDCCAQATQDRTQIDSHNAQIEKWYPAISMVHLTIRQSANHLIRRSNFIMSRDSVVVMCTCPPLTPPCCKSGDAHVGKDGHSDQLIELAASTGDKAEDLGRKAERRSAVLAEIARRSCDPEFDLTDAARGLGLSRRYIQRLLE